MIFNSYGRQTPLPKATCIVMKNTLRTMSNSVVAHAQHLDDLTAVAHLQLLLDARELTADGTGRLVQQVRYLTHRVAVLVQAGHLLLLRSQRKKTLGLADDALVLAHAAHTAMNLLEIQDAVLHVLRQQVVFAEVAADEALHLVEGTMRRAPQDGHKPTGSGPSPGVEVP